MDTSNFIVTVHYDPGVPKRYAVIGAVSWYAAKQAVLREIGYNPGVEISWLTLREGDAADQMIYMRNDEWLQHHHDTAPDCRLCVKPLEPESDLERDRR